MKIANYKELSIHLECGKLRLQIDQYYRMEMKELIIEVEDMLHHYIGADIKSSTVQDIKSSLNELATHFEQRHKLPENI